MPTKLLIIAALALIIFHLFRALYALARKGSQPSQAVVRSLTIRVALSVALFALLLLGSHWGWIPSHGLLGR